MRQASEPAERRPRWKWKKCWRDGAKSALAATLDVNIRIPLSARKWGITGKKVAPRMTPMLRCKAVKSLHRTKARRHPTTNEFVVIPSILAGTVSWLRWSLFDNVCSAMIFFSLVRVVVRVSRTVWGAALSLPARSNGPRDYSHREVPCTVTGIVSSSLRQR